MLHTDGFTEQVSRTVLTGNILSYVPGIAFGKNTQICALIDAVSCLLPIAGGSR